MWIRDFWNRVLAKFRKADSASVPVMELKAEEAPEPVPERKTSDEMIIEMAQSAVEPAQPDDRIIEAEPEAEAELDDRIIEAEPEAETEPDDRVIEAEPEAEAEYDDYMIAEEPEVQPEDEAEEEEKNGFEEEY